MSKMLIVKRNFYLIQNFEEKQLVRSKESLKNQQSSQFIKKENI